jgi:CIC family chloride channel protein
MPHSDPAPPVFRATYRLLLASILVGVVGAGAALAFEFLVEFAQGILLGGIGGYSPPEVGVLEPEAIVPSGVKRLWLPVVTTLGGLLSGFLVYRFAPEAEGHGTDAAISAYHEHGGSVRSRIPIVKAIASALTIGSGGVAGREGPTAQIAVGLGGVCTRWLGLRGQDRRSVLLAAMAAGLAAMFRAPLGMAIFTVEILYAGMVFESEALIYTVIAAVTSYAVFGFFSGWESVFEIPGGLSFHEPAALVGFALLGILAGLIGAVLPTLLYRTQALFRRLPGPPHIRPAVGGLLVGLMALAAPQILGTGYGWVELAMAEKLGLTTILLILVLKGPAMALTIGSGGSGGVFAPTVTLGATLGAAVGLLLQGQVPGVETPVAAYVVVGMAAIFAGAARTPISTLIMVAEMTGGYGLVVPAMLANVLAFLVQSRLTHDRLFPTLYRSQVETREDSPLHRGVFVRRAIEIVERGHIDSSEIRLPRLVNLLRYGEPIPVAEGEELLIALEVEPGSRLVGVSVMDSLGKIEGATAVAVLREEEMLVPRGPTTFASGDRVLIVATPEAGRQAQVLAADPIEAAGDTAR